MCDKISYRDAAKCQDCIINQYENPDLWCKNGCIKSELTPPPKPAYDLLMEKKRLHPDITMWFVGEKCKECGCKAGQIKGERKPAVLTVNHLYRDCYNSFEDYLKFEADRAEVTCTTCNWMFEKGKNICPVCFSETVAKYKHWNQPTCSACFLKAHPKIKEARDKRTQEKRI